MSIFETIANRLEKYEIAAEKVVFAIEYLHHYGYLIDKKIDSLDELTVIDVVSAVKKFQEFFGNLAVDGEIGPKTLNAMYMPRCGCPDFMSARREARWNKNELKYFIRGWVEDGISKTQQRNILKRAWQSWMDVANLHIEETRSAEESDIVIDVGSGRQHNFDGPGGTLAWAYLPDGRDRRLLMRFDLGETWILNPHQRGILLLNVAAHEFGHLLGLEHSRKQGALMAPYYNPNVAAPVHDDDVLRIRGLYGKPERDEPEPGPEPEPNDPDKEPKESVIVIRGDINSITSTGHYIYPKPE